MTADNVQTFLATNGFSLSYEFDSVPVRVHDQNGHEVFRFLLSGGLTGESVIKLASGEYNPDVAKAARELAQHLGVKSAKWERRKPNRKHQARYQG
ncbi:hypothetical protein IT774_05220 [Salinimonas marina]|uniref:Uncharacterized protein n=1 Tax=Salinimonas marina TaxID=2785918 RepID=A0A7S9HDU8_9ALTE|nr:hypothetical protein [Salinimonas marina]QPG06575.1 hypothetical protein IT774_05220 [Salinimonas marina]